MHGVQRAIWFEDDGVLFRLAVTEITYAPKCARDLAGVDAVDEIDSAAFAQKLIRLWIRHVHELCVVNVARGIYVAPAQNLIGTIARAAGIDGKFEVVADRCGFYFPDQDTANDKAQREQAKHRGSE